MINGLRQSNFRSDTIIKVRQHTPAVHTFQCGGQAQQELSLIVGQQLLGWRCRMVKLVHLHG